MAINIIPADRKPVLDSNKNGLLKYPPPPPAVVGAQADSAVTFAPWTHMTFEDKDIPGPPGYSYVKNELPIFKHSPDFPDVRQGTVGNCYLLSAINAIIKTEAEEFFYNLIGADDEYVQVRFFISAGGAPVIVRVKNTILCKDNTINGKIEHHPIQQHAAPWPYFIEKAYAALRMYYLHPFLSERWISIQPKDPVPSLLDLQKKFPAVAVPENKRHVCNYIEAITGGLPDESYTHLTSRKMEKLSLNREISQKPEGFNGRPPFGKPVSVSVYHSELLRCLLSDANPGQALGVEWDVALTEAINMTKYKYSSNNSGHPLKKDGGKIFITDFKEFIREVKNHIASTKKDNRELISGLEIIIETKIKENRELRIDEIYENIMKIKRSRIDLSALGMKTVDFGEIIIEFIEKSFPGKRGTGKYTNYQLEIFRALSECFSANADSGTKKKPSVAFASTRTDFSKKINKDNMIIEVNSDMERKGLVPRHAYQVGGINTINMNHGNGDFEIKFIYIRNPWHNYVRKYSPKLKENDQSIIRKIEESPLKFVLSSKTYADNRNENTYFPPTELMLEKLSKEFKEFSKTKIEKNKQQQEEKNKLREVKNMEQEMKIMESISEKESWFFPVELSDLTKFFGSISVSRE